MRLLLDDYFKSEGISVRKQRSNGRRRYSSEDNKNQQRRDNREFAVDHYSGYSKQELCHVEKQKFDTRTLVIKCKTDAQKDARHFFHKSDILALIGPAGCGKTWLSTVLSVNELYCGRAKKLIFARPLVDAGEQIGFLPGDLLEKADPYMRPIYDCLDELVGDDPEFREFFDKHIEIVPLAFTRGRTFKNAICVLDEAQNATHSQLKMFLTRFDENSRVILNGDPTQIDIPNSGLERTIDELEGMEGFNVIDFHPNDNVRHPKVAEIHRRMTQN